MSDITKHYGGTVLALKGPTSIVLMSDLRLGQGSLTTSRNFSKIHRIDNLFICLPQFIPDSQALLKRVTKNHNLFVLQEQRPMQPKELAHMVSYILYTKRGTPYYTSPIVAGIGSDGVPYICGMDCIGCMSEPDDFVVAGSAEKNMAGMCEAVVKSEYDNDDLFTAGGQVFLNSVDRDALSGWGCEGILIQKDKVVKRKLKMRQD
ncbi:proteasome core particle subunit beta 3 [Conglomerata obtusa]